MKKQIKYSIILPAFNEEKAIGNILKELTYFFSSPYSEIIVVNDGSTDKTAEVVKNYNVKLINNKNNKGYGVSLKTGIKSSSGQIICLMDSDGQHSVGDLKRLVDEFEKKEYDLLIGSRDRNSHFPLLRRPGKKFLQVFANYLTGVKIPDLNSGLRIFKKEIILKFIHLMPNGFSFSTTSTIIFLQEGFEVGFEPITVLKRVGKSTVTLKVGLNTILLIIRLVTIFSPLKVFLPVSFVLGSLGFIRLILELFIYQNVSDSSMLLILVSILLFFFGLLSDQIAHIRRELKN